MKFKSSIVASGRGSIGGITLSSNSFGTFFRARSKPCVNQSAPASSSKAIIGSLHGLWRGLPATSKLGWQAAADFLDGSKFARSKRYGTGLNYFIAYNSLVWRRRDTSLFRTLPPAFPHRGTSPIVEVVVAAIGPADTAEWTCDISVLDAPAVPPTGGWLYCSTSYPLPRGTSIWPKKWDSISFLEVSEIGSMPMNVSISSISLFGPCRENAGAAMYQTVWDQGWFSHPTVIIRDLNPLP